MISLMFFDVIKAANKLSHEFLCSWIADIHRNTVKNLIKNERALESFAITNHFNEESLKKITFKIELSYLISRVNLINLKNYTKIYSTAKTSAILIILQVSWCQIINSI